MLNVFSTEKSYGKLATFLLVVALHIIPLYAMIHFGMSGQMPIKAAPTEITATLISVQREAPPNPTPAEHQRRHFERPPQDKPKTYIKRERSEHRRRRAEQRPVVPPTPTSITEKSEAIQEPQQQVVQNAQPADVEQRQEQVQKSSSGAPASSGAPKTIDFSDVSYVNAPSPNYPNISRRLGEQGLVKFRVLINAEGRAEKIILQQSSGYERLDNVAKDAISRATFKPYKENGQPVPVYAIIPISFKL